MLMGGCSVKDANESGNSKSTGGPTVGSPENVGNSVVAAKTSEKLSGEIRIDGSSTVYPISQAMAEAFLGANSDVKPTIKKSGTGPGMKAFGEGECDIAGASRPIKPDEAEKCKSAGIEYIELKIAIDGLTVVVNKDNDWATKMTVAQLKQLWAPESKVTKWKDLDPAWPDEEIRLFGPDTASGTFDYFTEAIVGKSKASRTDYTPSTDDNVLVKGVTGGKFGLGYFGYAYFAENASKLKAVAVAAGDDVSAAVAPSDETILNGTYKPLARPLFLYVNVASLKKPQVAEFVKFALGAGQSEVTAVRYVPLPSEDLAESKKRLDEVLGR
jgi:phosphate transport system substrate-binding protein